MQEPYPPSSAFLWGVIAGTSVVVLGALAALFLGQEGASTGIWVLILTPLFGGAVAAALPAIKQGALDSRIFAVSFAALVCSFLISWILEYTLLLDLFTSEDIVEKTGRFFWIRYGALSILAVPTGALIGMGFGKPPRF